MMRNLILVGAAVLLSACASQASPVEVNSCPVTQPPQPPFSPPIEIEAYEGLFWYGSPALWTILPLDGTWQELPHDASGYTQKFVFWREGFDAISEPNPALTLRGRRLDGWAPTFTESDATHGFDETGAFMLMGATIPTEGCWEFTTEYQEASLTFVVLVTP